MSKTEPTERMLPGTLKWALGWADHLARYQLAAANVAGKRVLDVGCGTGYGTQWLAKSGAARVTGIDHSEDALSIARSEYPGSNIRYVRDDAQKLEHVNDRFDIIVAFEILEHVPDPQSLLRRCGQLLAPGGSFYCSTPNSRLTPKDTGDGKPANPFHVREFTFDEFAALIHCSFEHATFLGEDFSPGYKRMAAVVEKLQDEIQARDFLLWSNPFVRLGRWLQGLKGHQIEWPQRDRLLFAPQIEDIIISEEAVSDAPTFIACARSPR